MNDLPSSLGIEAVELVYPDARPPGARPPDARPPSNITVRVTGRWRRRRAELRGQAMLVLEGPVGRQRFLAMPEPPSLTGAAPGTWRMSFSVPAALAPSLPGRTLLQLGGVMVPLPIGETSIAGEPAAWRRAGGPAGQVERLEHELHAAREESERLRASIAERERRLRAADQHVHAEQALRADLEQELTRRTRAARQDLAALRGRVGDLERELTRMRRVVDEAAHLTAAAKAARAEAERRLAERPPPAASSPPFLPQAASIRRELELRRATPAAPPPGPPHRPPARPRDVLALRQEKAMGEGRAGPAGAEGERVGALVTELAAAREEIEAQRWRTARAYEAIELVRNELRELRAGAPAAARPPAPMRPARPPGRAAPTPGPVQAERLSEALARLRERNPASPSEEAAETAPATRPFGLQPAPADRPVKPWLGRVFRSLVRQDPSAGGHLLLALLPAQRAADPHPVAYDLVLSDVLCAHVTVDSATAHVTLDPKARPLGELDFQVIGDLAGIARLLAAGPLRRRLGRLAPGRRMARVRGDRRRFAALDGLIGARLTLGELGAAGVELDPLLTMTVAALMIEAEWTAGERFTIAHRRPAEPSPEAYLHVRDGRAPLASDEAPHGPVSTVIACAAEELAGVLAGSVTGEEITGDQRAPALLAQWLERAQCG